jgi:preprotein translocase subunit SecY
MRWLKDIGADPGQPIYVMLMLPRSFSSASSIRPGFQQPGNCRQPEEEWRFHPRDSSGEQTRYIDKILVRLTLAGAIYITFVCLLPEFLILKYNVPFYFGGTSLLIIVVVTMDFMAQVQNYVMSQQYESLLKKANFKAGI